MHFDFGDGRGQFEQIWIAKIVDRAAPRGKRVASRCENRVPAFAPGKNLVRVVRGIFSGVDGRDRISVLAEPQIQIGWLQSEQSQIRLRVVGDKLRRVRGLKLLQRGGDALRIGARLQRTRHAPEPVRGVAVQLDDFRSVGQDDGIKIILRRVHERGAAPFVRSVRKKFQPAGVGHERAVNAIHADENLVAGRGLVAD